MGQIHEKPPSKEQRTRACRTLLALIGQERLWSVDGPTPEAVRMLQQYGGQLSNDDWVVFQVAWSIWGRETGVRLNEILRLSGQRQTAVVQLLDALASGASAVEDWLRRTRNRPLEQRRLSFQPSEAMSS